MLGNVDWTTNQCIFSNLKMLYRLGTTTLHNGMILSTMSTSFVALLLVFPKGLVPMEIYSLKPMIIPLANVGLPPNNPQQYYPWTKYTIESPMRPYGTLEQPPP